MRLSFLDRSKILPKFLLTLFDIFYIVGGFFLLLIFLRIYSTWFGLFWIICGIILITTGIFSIVRRYKKK